MSHCSILEMINYGTWDLCMRIRVQLLFSKKDMEIRIQSRDGPQYN